MKLLAKIVSAFMLVVLLFGLLNIQAVQRVEAAGPDPVTGESKISLNGTWNFITDPSNRGESESWFSPAFNRSAWEPMKVPGNWDTENKYSEYKGTAWYQRAFTVPADAQGFPARLQFGAVAHLSSVWVNGVKVVSDHRGSYSAFEADLVSKSDGTPLLDGAGQPLLKYGAENIVVVKVNNLAETWDGSAWWHWGGISRDVDLVINQDAKMMYQHITATPDLTNGTASIKVDVKAQNLSATSKILTVSSKIYDKSSGNLVWSSINDSAFTSSGAVAARAQQILSLQTTLPANLVKLWNFDHPNLYRMETEIREGGMLKHKLLNQFGVRKIEWNTGQFKINGEPVRLNGANRVPDDRVNGNTQPNYLIKRDLDTMKEAGVNMTRIFHTQQDPDLLDYADEIGILIVEEIPYWGNNAPANTNQQGHVLAEKWVTDMVEADYNHPSIIGWSVANEIASGTKPDDYVQHMFNFVRQNLDNSRFLTYVTNKILNKLTTDAARFSDIIFINMYGSFGSVSSVASTYPNKPIFVSEYGIGLTGEDPDSNTFDPASVLNAYKNIPQVIGASVWTYNDYRSAYTSSSASQNRSWGAVTVWGEKKKWFEKFRNANSPVRSIDLVQAAAPSPAGSDQTTKITLSPRAAIDLPSYTMNDYKLKWEVFDNNNQVTGGGITDIPVLHPGDAAWSTTISWKVPAAGVLKQRFAVVSPTQHEVKEQEAYFSVPKPAMIMEIIPADGGVRVVFNKAEGAESHKIIYGTTILNKTTAATINDFVDIAGLTNNTAYQFSVVATNAKGDSTGSGIVNATPQDSQRLLPPKLWKAVGVDGGFYVGYTGASGTFADESNNVTTYSIKYGTSNGNYTQTLNNIKNYGAFKVSGLTNGITYYFRVKMDKSVNGTYYGTSGWSEELSVMPKADTAATANPVLYSAVSGNGQVSLSFNNVEKATGYRVKYGTSAGSLTSVVNVNLAAVGQYTITGLTNGTTYYFAVSALNNEVESGLSNVRSTTPDLSENPQMQPLLTDNFEDGDAQGWIASSGSWSFVMDATYAYKQSANTASEALTTTGNTAWTNYDVQADVKLKSTASGAATGVIGRYMDNNNYYHLRLNKGEGKLQLLKKVNGTFTELGYLPLTISLDTVYNLKLSMMGSTIKGYLNGVERLSVQDTSIAAGKIGIRTYNQIAIADNVEVVEF
ncbi:glycoside hydrolase family 2 TIM barrel-domain containing protein [Paenibacillus alba]|uniref:glycoside hydrolase family 2 TIM barrel-domain containing protein n=1 Tax=Paenibacillus alba TaxID=1197127 RepID=UPI001563193D